MALIGVAFGLGFVTGPAIGGSMVHLAKKFSTDPIMGSTVAAFLSRFYVFPHFYLRTLSCQNRFRQKKGAKTEVKQNRFIRILNKLKLPVLRPLLSIFFIAGLAMSCIEATLVFFVGERFGLGPDKVSYGFAYIGLIIIFTQGFLSRRLIPILGERRISGVGLSLFALGSLGIALSDSLSAMAVAMTLFSIGNGLNNPSLLGSIRVF